MANITSTQGSQKLSQLAGKPINVRIYEGETLEQAEERVLKEHPEAFAQKPSGALPPQLMAIAEQAAASGDKKEIAKAQATIELYKATQPKEASPSNSAEAAKLLEIVTGGITNLKDLEDEVNKGNLLVGQALPYGIGDRKVDFLLNDITDRLGRLRSGGAITEGTNGSGGELGRFEKNPPGPLDFGKDAKLYKINKLKEQFTRVGQNLKGEEGFNSYLEKLLSKNNTSNPPSNSPAINVDQNAIAAEIERRRKLGAAQ